MGRYVTVQNPNVALCFCNIQIYTEWRYNTKAKLTRHVVRRSNRPNTNLIHYDKQIIKTEIFRLRIDCFDLIKFPILYVHIRVAITDRFEKFHHVS